MVKQSETLDQFLVRVADILFPDGSIPEPYNIHSKSSDGDTPLHMAALWGDRHAAGLLIDAGADLDAKGDMSCTPLYFAVMNHHVLVAELLLRHGADPDVMTELNFSPRTLALTARTERDPEMIELFRSSHR